MSSLFSKRLTWLYRSLGMNEPQIPVRLDNDTVQSVLDVFQGGQSLGQIEFDTFDFGENQAENDVTVIESSETDIRIIHYIDVFNSAATTWFWSLTCAKIGNIFVRVSQQDILPAAIVGHSQLLEDAGRLYLFPGFVMRVHFTATGPGDVRRFQYIAQRIPFGFDPNY